MKLFRRIVVGVDLGLDGRGITPGSRRACLQAEWIAEKTGAELTLVHSTWSDIHEQDGLVRSGLSPEGGAALEELLEEYRASGLPVELVLTKERPWMDLVQRALRGEHDLVVVARRNAVQATGLGSVTRKLLRKCPVPVWVVRAGAELLHDRILAATDLSGVGDRAVHLAASIAQQHGCELHIVHAWQVPLNVQLSAEWKGEEHQAELDAIQDNALRHIRDSLEAGHPGMQAQFHVGRDAPSRAIREGVDKLNPDLLVMGTVSRGGIAGFLMGNTAERILDTVECSLLTIKPPDFVSPVQV